MRDKWEPAFLGRMLTAQPDWQLRLDGHDIELTVGAKVHKIRIEGESTLRLRHGLLWTDIAINSGQVDELRVRGLPNTRAISLKSALKCVLADLRQQKEGDELIAGYSEIHAWLQAAESAGHRSDGGSRWITYEVQQSLQASKPQCDSRALWTAVRKPEIRSRLSEDPAIVEEALKLWESDWSGSWLRANDAHVTREILACKDLFDRVESQPLTEEQARAVVCFDNRVQVVASAGSGKTSTMVAKAAYAIHRGLVAPDQIVLLAFNKKAAEELKARATRAFERLGMNGITVEATTFHALGLGIVGKATGRKPDVPDWATDANAGLGKLSGLIDHLKDQSAEFASRWDLFRWVFARDLPAFGSSVVADGWDKDGSGYLSTIRNERVRSQEELMIANWLFANGVDYQYERRYELDTVTESHSQYRPDFYYPAANLYHEHFALDEMGRAPQHFAGYLNGVAWKRQLHQENGTELIETTSHLLRNGDWIAHLSRALTDRGIKLDFNPDRPLPEGSQKPMENIELAGLMRTFISHAKSNSLNPEALNDRLDDLPVKAFKQRYRMFLDLAIPLMQAWDAALAAEGGIDFEDMLNLAAESLEQGRYKTPYLLVMADEFQDASRARARLCSAMVRQRGHHFFAVGDDWQSINRFAGADVSVMTDFREFFGHGQVLKLEQTFRCPQELCDISSSFVLKNPAQIEKRVRSVTVPTGPVAQVFQVDQREKVQDAIDRYLEKLCQEIRDGQTPPGRGEQLSVAVLGRYNADRAYLPEHWKTRYGRWLNVEFSTIHRSKGSEADYVVLPSMISRLRGNSFPNVRVDDSVLALAMPASDNFLHGEERRLFYVALTRARRGVAMFTVRGQRSPFLDELIREQMVVVTDSDGDAVEEVACPACKQGVIVTKNGPYGEFLSCCNFPVCEYKPRQRNHQKPLVSQERSGAQTAASTKLVRRPPAEVTPMAGMAGSFVSPVPTLPSVAASAKSIEPAKPVVAERSTLRGFFASISTGLDDLNKSVSRAQAVQAATSSLSLDIHAEYVAIKCGLESARHSVELRKKFDADPQLERIYEESRKNFEALFEREGDAKRMADTQALARPVPDFQHVTKHANAETDEAIQRKVAGMKSERAAFLSAVHVELSRNEALRGHFRKKLHMLGGEHYWSALDPQSALHDE